MGRTASKRSRGPTRDRRQQTHQATRLRPASITPLDGVPGLFKSRVVGHGFEAPDQLLAHPQNWRIHSAIQEQALEGVLEDVGWVRGVLVNRTTGHVLDGHLRVALAIRRNEPRVPVDYVEVSPEEELVILAALDPIAGMAGTDKDKLASLIEDIKARQGIEGLVEQLRAAAAATAAEAAASAETKSLSEQFGVPPFSVLNAREGWWQDRKRAWIALGIQSELGRGGPEGSKANAIPGGAPMPLDRKKAGKPNATPGGSKMPAADYSKNKARGDGRGRAVRK